MDGATVSGQPEEFSLQWTQRTSSRGNNSNGSRDSFNGICLTAVFTIAELCIQFATYRQNDFFSSLSSKGLFTRREGYPSKPSYPRIWVILALIYFLIFLRRVCKAATVTLAGWLNFSLVNTPGRLTRLPGLTF